MGLDELIAQAQDLKSRGGHDNILADQLAVAATQHYGVQNRSPELIKIIKLSGSLREIKKPEWSTQFEVLDVGDVPPPQEPGYFFISQYGFGRVDLLKDGQRVNRIYGIVLRLNSQDTRTRLPRAYNDNFNVEREHVTVRARIRRGKDLIRRIESSMDFMPQNGLYALLLETYQNDDSIVHADHPALDDNTLELNNNKTAKQLIMDNLNQMSEYIARYHLHVRQVGRVVDGGKRYKR